MSGLPPVDDCVATVVDACETDLAPIFTDPRTRYSPMRAAEVIAEGYDLMNDCSTDIAQWYVFELLSVMRGDSGPRVNCAPPGGSFQDDPAAFWQCDADMDLVCRPNSSGGWECQGASAAGGACNIIYHCQRGLYCTSYILGSCQPQKDRGDECTDGTECRSLVCGDSGTCDELDRSVYCVPVEDFFGDQMGG